MAEFRVISIERHEAAMEVPGAEQMMDKVRTAIVEFDG